jgi:bifunctional UDP-N-acetylglucosamine pyrophosphorylase / glucosamine-1-phosphate N-acetyltransferase
MLKEKIKILILAGGKGKRMQSELPKVLVPIKDKPMLAFVLESIQQITEEKPIVIVGHKKEMVIEEFKNQCIYAIQEEQLGTGHAVMCAKDQTKDTEHVVVLSGDQPLITPQTIEKLIKKHIEQKSQITFTTTVVPDFSDWRQGFLSFGRIIRNDENKIIGIKEYKDATEEEKEIKEVNAGCYIFESSFLWENLKKIENTNAQNEYYLTDLFKIAFNENQKIESIQIDPKEALGANTKEELEILSNFV